MSISSLMDHAHSVEVVVTRDESIAYIEINVRMLIDWRARISVLDNVPRDCICMASQTDIADVSQENTRELFDKNAIIDKTVFVLIIVQNSGGKLTMSKNNESNALKIEMLDHPQPSEYYVYGHMFFAATSCAMRPVRMDTLIMGIEFVGNVMEHVPPV